jgi:hypothetical protein
MNYRHYAIVIAVLLGGAADPARAQQNDIWTQSQVEQYFSATWDWRTVDPTQWVSYYGAPILVPWTADHAGGIPVAGTDMPQPTKGWRLYEKHLSCVDYGLAPSCLTRQPGTLLPHFSLYNVYAGTLRTFVFMDRAQVQDERILFATDVVTAGSNGGPSDHGLFLNVGDLATPLSAKTAARNSGYSSLVNALYGKWLVYDREISYDSTAIPNNLVFYNTVWGIRQEKITLQGELTERAVEAEQPASDPFAELEFVVGAGGTIVKRVAGATAFATEMKKREEYLRGHNYTNLADAAAGLATATEQVGIVVSVIVAGLEIINSFTKTFGGGNSVQYTPKSMSVRLAGGIYGQRSLDEFRIGAYGSAQTVEPGYTPTLRYQGKLGLFSLIQAPLVEVGDDYLVLRDRDLRSFVAVNPATGMELVDLKVQPIVVAPVTQACSAASCAAEWPISNALYTNVQQLPGYEQGTSIRARVTNGFVSPDAIDFTWNPRSGHYAWDPFIGAQTDNSSPPRVLLKVFLRFQHKDPAHADSTFVEVVRTYDAALRRIQCSLSGAQSADELYDDRRNVGHVMSNDISRYTHRPCALPPGQVLLFRHRAYRALDVVRASTNTPVHRTQLPSDDLTRFLRLYSIQHPNCCPVEQDAEHYGVGVLGFSKVGNDALSSFIVAPFTEVTLFQNQKFGGNSITLSQSVPNLATMGWDNRASSVRVRLNHGWIVPLF